MKVCKIMYRKYVYQLIFVQRQLSILPVVKRTYFLFIFKSDLLVSNPNSSSLELWICTLHSNEIKTRSKYSQLRNLH